MQTFRGDMEHSWVVKEQRTKKTGKKKRGRKNSVKTNVLEVHIRDLGYYSKSSDHHLKIIKQIYVLLN